MSFANTYYYLKKSTLISIIPNSAMPASVAFKRSLIENQNITEDEAKKIIKIITSLVEKANAKSETNLTDFYLKKHLRKIQYKKNSISHKKSPESPTVTPEKSNTDDSNPRKKEEVIVTACPHCNQHYEVDAKYVDEIIKCQHCGQDFVIEPLS